MKFTLLGTGTSQGIPVIGCDCETCTSEDVRDKRRRCSAYITTDNGSVMIDVGPDFRSQALDIVMSRLDAVFLTHEHNDHVAGLDDLRPLMFKNMKPMALYAEQRVLDDIRVRYRYAFTPQPYPGAPRFEPIAIRPGDVLHIGDIKIAVHRTYHGQLPILAFVVQDQLAYLTDTNEVPEEMREAIMNIPTLVIDMLRERYHHSHNTLEGALAAAASIRASQTFFIHMSHLMGPTRVWEQSLPPDVFPAYDGLSFDLEQD